MGMAWGSGISLGVDTELRGEGGGSWISLWIGTVIWGESGAVGFVWGLIQGYEERAGQ